MCGVTQTPDTELPFSIPKLVLMLYLYLSPENIKRNDRTDLSSLGGANVCRERDVRLEEIKDNRKQFKV